MNWNFSKFLFMYNDIINNVDFWNGNLYLISNFNLIFNFYSLKSYEEYYQKLMIIYFYLGYGLKLDSNFLWVNNYDEYNIKLIILHLYVWYRSKFSLLYNYVFLMQWNLYLYVKILPFIVSILGFNMYFFLDDRFIIYYHNYYYRMLVLKLHNGLFFDKLFIDVLVAKFYLLSYYSFYKNIESSFFQKYNIFIFEKKIFNFYFFFKIFSKGYFFVYILIVLCFIYFYFFFIFIFKFLNYSFLPAILILYIFSFLIKWTVLKSYIVNFLVIYVRGITRN